MIGSGMGRASFATTQPRQIRYGAAVCGSFLVASVVGVAFEAGESAYAMTASAFVSSLIFWLAHAWSEVVGERVAAGGAFRHRDILVIARRQVAITTSEK
jgi:phosphatidylserine/phosphatidylglycerophosphate/cardiolipin synthase-like enzyme